MMNIVLSLLTASSSHAAIAKVPAACYTMARKAAVEAVKTEFPTESAYVRNTDFARTSPDGRIYVTVWVKMGSREFADALNVYVHADGLGCVIDDVR